MIVLDILNRYLFPFILLSLTAGVSVSVLSGGIPFSPWICVVAALVMVYPSLVPLSITDGIRFLTGRRGRVTLVYALFFNAIIAPVLAYTLGAVFFPLEPAFRFGLLLIGLLPGGGMTTTWALRSKADMGMTVGSVVSAMGIAMLTAPFVLSGAIDAWTPETSETDMLACPVSSTTGGMFSCGGPDMSPASFLPALVVVFVIPLVLSVITRHIVLKRYDDARAARSVATFGKAGSAGLLLVLFLLALSSGDMLTGMTWVTVGRALLAVVAFYGVYIAMIAIVARDIAEAPRRAAFVWGTSLRYITLALGIAVSIAVTVPSLAGAMTVVALSYVVQIPVSFLIERILSSERYKSGTSGVTNKTGV